jgi:hypothetical protein
MAKNKFADLDEDFKTRAEAMSEEELRATISKVSLNHVAMLKVKEQDEDLKLKKEVAKEAGAQYREEGKFCKLAIAYCSAMLEAKGKDNGSFSPEDGIES